MASSRAPIVAAYEGLNNSNLHLERGWGLPSERRTRSPEAWRAKGAALRRTPVRRESELVVSGFRIQIGDVQRGSGFFNRAGLLYQSGNRSTNFLLAFTVIRAD